MAIHALAGMFNVRIAMRAPGDWYISANNIYTRRENITGTTMGSGSDPYVAIHDYWKLLSTQVIYKDNKPFKWNGFMWVPQPE